LLALLFLKPFTTIDEGERGVKLTFGKASQEMLSPGLVLFIPVIQVVKVFDIKLIKHEEVTNVYTKDVQQAEVKIAINVHLDESKIVETYEKYGQDWFRKIIMQRVQDSTKAALGKWDAVELIANRDKGAADIKEILTQSLVGYPIILEAVSITNIDYSDVFEKAIETKVVATQRAIEAQNNTLRIKEEANQKIISAQAEAESMRIRANALTQNASLVQYEAVQKWNGILPQYMLGNSVPFINFTK
jgi:regulator of protease activity HflC (stomatin/prohibitin superfamily)